MEKSKIRGAIRSSGAYAFLRSLSQRGIRPGSGYTTELIKIAAAIKTLPLRFIYETPDAKLAEETTFD